MDLDINQMDAFVKIREKLRLSEDVDAVFITGSYGVKQSKSYSDIDLVIILRENKNNIYSLYRWVDDVFADIFFFDSADLKRIESQIGKYDNPMDGVFMTWLKKADIKFDKSGAITNLKSKADGSEEFIVSAKEKQNLWQKINYNFIANRRYFESGDPLYHQALELRLLYSVVELICGYLALRNIAWRGEKEAVMYLKDNHPDFYGLFEKYCVSSLLSVRFGLYAEMVDLVFTDEYKKWTKDDEVIIKKDFLIADKNDSVAGYVKSLFE